MGGGSTVLSQGYWRFYADASPPSVTLGNENGTGSLVNNTNIIRLRISIAETGGTSGSGAWLVQVSTDESSWTDLGASAAFNWANGADSEGNVVSTSLSDANFAGVFIESGTYSSSVQKSKVSEFDLAIAPTANIVADTTYYFQVVTIGSDSVAAGASHPSVLSASAGGTDYYDYPADNEGVTDSAQRSADFSRSSANDEGMTDDALRAMTINRTVNS